MNRNFVKHQLSFILFLGLIVLTCPGFSQQSSKNTITRERLHFVTYKKYEIANNKSFFHSSPTAESIRKSYLVMGNYIVPIKKVDGFYYIEYKNSDGNISKGWISKNDVLEVDSITREDQVIASTKPKDTIQKRGKNLSFENLLELLDDSVHSDGSLLSIIKKQNSKWQFKGEDPENGEIFFMTSNNETRELLSWHTHESLLEYTTLNKSQYLDLIKEIKWTGFDVTKRTTNEHRITTIYSEENFIIQVSQILLHDRKSYAYQFYMGEKR